MKNTQPCAVELLLIAAVLVASALLTLTTALVALVLTVASYCQPWLLRPAAVAAPSTGPGGAPENVPTPRASVVALRHTPPAVHPLLLALEPLTVAQLRPLAGTRSKRRRRAELIDLAGIAMAC
jgi:hypothetical protein